jgi:hypothetical protein
LFRLQPSVRGLFSAIASVRQKLDNIMPTLTGAEEAVQLARKFLVDRVTVQQQQHLKRRDSNVSIMSSISQFGMFTTVCLFLHFNTSAVIF